MPPSGSPSRQDTAAHDALPPHGRTLGADPEPLSRAHWRSGRAADVGAVAAASREARRRLCTVSFGSAWAWAAYAAQPQTMFVNAAPAKTLREERSDLCAQGLGANCRALCRAPGLSAHG